MLSYRLSGGFLKGHEVAQEQRINIIGAGLSGLSAAYTLAKAGCFVRLISVQPSERAQSNLAEGGINAALDVMGEEDDPTQHMEDTMECGCDLADPVMVKGLCEEAPSIIRELERLGMPFHRNNGKIVQRFFGGQKKKRAAYSGSITGKALTSTMIDAVRRFESEGKVERLFSHFLIDIDVREGELHSLFVRNDYTNEINEFYGPTIFCFGGMNGIFPGMTTGTYANTGSAAALLFSSGFSYSNLEFIQYHPTTIRIPGKRLLVSEAARGEGGRLFYFAGDKKNYFLEEKYGERGNLMPRDVVSREIAFSKKDVFLDMTGIETNKWGYELKELREELIYYLSLDPKKEYIPVAPGIHFFMGGLSVDREHRTSVKGCYAAGECASAYHGANRMGGNSLLAAIYSGKVAAKTIIEDFENGLSLPGGEGNEDRPIAHEYRMMNVEETAIDQKRASILSAAMGVVRDKEGLEDAYGKLLDLQNSLPSDIAKELVQRIVLSLAMIKSALQREESRGAHFRSDHPERKEEYKKTTIARINGHNIITSFDEIGRV